ncbi:interferon alpha-B-like [Mastacembelus armatus]|uniref:Interferon alpha-B-like n=1 Tax=Mastacembelus armatus TaxID=205130 RepID=A0A3Q3NF09_9TELE|nr:interferon alpha-B-like [Mastacembelus armatus]
MPMMLSSALLILLQLCSLQVMTVAMPRCGLQATVVQTAYNLLKDLGGPFPVHCLQYNANISFPDSAFPATSNHFQCDQALRVVYESLRGAWLIFNDHDELPDGLMWNKDKFDIFHNLQGRLLKEGSCFSSVGDSGVLSSYFSNVTAVLQQQDSAACGWMALRRDLLRVLMYNLQQHRNCFTKRPAH